MHMVVSNELDKRKVQRPMANKKEANYDVDVPRYHSSPMHPLLFMNLTHILCSWEPARDFNYPVIQLPIVLTPHIRFSITDFSDVRHFADGSHANIFTAMYNERKVVIKIIKREMKDDPISVHEFDAEQGMLARVKHPHIIALYGAGFDGDRKFLVLEYLGGGSMRQMLEDTAKKRRNSIISKLTDKKTFSYEETLKRARQLASALNYLHRECNTEACIIHRDLKPDNIAFADDGRLVLFDLGLCTIVRRGSSADTVYEMTGGTGSLRYMAPEVALEQPYNEKADLYSFAIILWQMAADQLPYEGASRASYLRYACKYGDRPDLNPRWPQGFKDLLTQCWHQEFRNRPSFDHVIEILDQLLGSI